MSEPDEFLLSSAVSLSGVTPDIGPSFSLLIFMHYLCPAITSIVVYDWAISLSRECQLFGTGNARTFSAWLYFANRYTNLFSQVVVLPMYLRSLSPKSCTHIVLAMSITSCLSMIPPAVFNSLRAFALSRSWSVSIFIFGLSLVPFASVMIEFGYHFTGIIEPAVQGCGVTLAYPIPLIRMSTILNRTCTIVADTLLIALTWRSLRRGIFLDRCRTLTKTDLMGVLLRDGTFYFIALLTTNILLIIILQRPPLNLASGDIISPYITGSLSSTLISRFMLDLQEAYQRKTVILVPEDLLCSLAAHIGAADLHLADAPWDNIVEARVDAVAEPHDAVPSLRATQHGSQLGSRQ
ncbi:hypothetical protein BD310DRAFT_881757 [Dichomitus squalens]|uniref:DUF6533 domain-containing protein n=1 Tax=Dichomitus squalens TaxID=114155 RepID=A0A4Q9PR95_9APHY|nr:hypothetical protein BD310DRAFT_881757 [Dichomitus squalens]